eukprot:CAMPEP_0117663526 /NCGR_PEP_ID=MMETSP0804-20121206/8661_1 /TAXON_ID=1074897 /ORGANISM="Tetraselmis astigmatica, Strain CCMP880" /LENGTH=76 /DNA_ID=CAMNT_0005470553 /DNA_START=56 /DNA_END=283 /DNA_ORIENTATION=-
MLQGGKEGVQSAARKECATSRGDKREDAGQEHGWEPQDSAQAVGPQGMAAAMGNSRSKWSGTWLTIAMYFPLIATS